MPLTPRAKNPLVCNKKALQRQRLAAFSLVELSVVLAILAVVATFGLEGAANFINRANAQVSRDNVTLVDEALKNYFRVWGRLPCPASLNLAPSSTSYGLENCSIAVASGTGAFGGGGIIVGAVPFRQLNLPMSISLDGWTNKINYAVTKNLTVAGTGAGQFGKTYTAAAIASTDGIGGIEVRTGILEEPCVTAKCQVVTNPIYDASDNLIPAGAAYVVFSTGPDQRGAYSDRGVQRRKCAATGTSEEQRVDAKNCINIDTTSTTNPVIPDNFVFYDGRFNNGLSTTYYFDDIVAWRTRAQLQ